MATMTRRGFVKAAGAGALVLFNPVGTGRAQGLVKITHAEAVETMFYLPLYVAHEKGFFREEGLDVTIYNAQQRTIALRAVIAGDAFTYNGDPAEPALGQLRGQDVKNIGVLVDRAGGDLLGKPGIPKNPKDWKGFRVITPRPPHTSVSLIQMMLLDAGYAKTDQDGLVWKPADSSNEKDFVRLNPVIAGSELSALVAGTAELSIVLEPNTALGISQGFQVIQSFAEAFGPFFYTSFATLGETIRKQPEMVQKFVNAMTKASVYGHNYPDRAVEVGVKRFSGSDPKIMAIAARRIIDVGAYPKNLTVTRKAYANNFDRLLVLTGHEAAKYPFEKLMDLSFAEKAAAQIKNVKPV